MKNQQDDRSRLLRQRCLERKLLAFNDREKAVASSLRLSETEKSWQIRRGLCSQSALSNVKFAIDDLELLMGRLAPRPDGYDDGELERARKYIGTLPSAGGQQGHCELDLSRIFKVGVKGLNDDITARLASASGASAEAYQSFLCALDGFSIMCENAAYVAESAMKKGAKKRKDELCEIAESCRRIAFAPPETFRDAIQLLWFVELSPMLAEGVGLIVPGHIDRTLAPFYERDIAAGRITPEKALVLIEALYLLINEYVPDGLAVSVMVGGRDASGNDVTNDLSYMGVEALRRTKLVYPTVGVCWHEGTPGKLVDLTVELIAKGYSTPAFFGDETIQKGLRERGLVPEQACYYINSTCVEITPSCSSNVWVASPYFNACGILLEEIAAQVKSPAGSMDEFMQRYKTRLAGQIADAVRWQNEMRVSREKFGRKPMQSVFTKDCIERGRDIDDGGAIHNWVECSFVGLANLADSLYVIREEIFKKHSMTIPQLKDILDKNYAGHEDVRIRFLRGYPKYGEGNAGVDDFVGNTVKSVIGECGKYKMYPDDSPFIPGAFVWIMHEQLGRQTGATPDGRQAAFPFADGCGPAQGRETKGPTAAILSTTSWDHSSMLGGLAYNMKFNSSLCKSQEGVDRLRDLILTYLRRNGFEVQVNVVDAEVLKKARKNPEQYRDLVVRIGGYTDYFTRLSEEMKDEVMLRTEFENI